MTSISSEPLSVPIDKTSTTRVRAAAPTNASVLRNLLTLTAALLLGGIAVWQLRQAWAKEGIWPWLFFLVAMFMGAQALRRLERWLPGEPILPSLATFPAPPRRLAGLICILIALALTGYIVLRLWPDYRQWHGTPALWLAALLLVVIGTWLVGAVGRGSPRAATALALWPASPRSRWLEAIAFLLIFALAIFLRT